MFRESQTIDGFVSKVNVNIGKYVNPADVLFELVNTSDIHLNLKVFEKDIEKLGMGQKIAFTLSTRPNKIYEAEIFALGKAFDLDTRSVKVHAKIIGTHEGLLTGMFVEARIATDSKMVDALPDEAFVNEKGEIDFTKVYTEQLKKSNLKAKFRETGDPLVQLYAGSETKSNLLLQIRVKVEAASSNSKDGKVYRPYMRNYVEAGPLMFALLN